MSNIFGRPERQSIDAGNRLRVSQISTLIDIKQINDNQPLLFDRKNVGSGSQAYAKADGGVTMSVTGGTDAAICQSKMFAPYYSGKSQFMEITFNDMSLEENVTKRAGYFSSNTTTPFDSNKDGIWLEASDDYYFVIEKNGTQKLKVAREDWGPEADKLNLSAFNVLIIQFLYLGGTAVKFGFIVDGAIVWVYTYVHAGKVGSTFVESPQQPIRYEIRSTGGSGSFEQICAQVASEGSIDEVGVTRRISSGALSFGGSSAGTEVAMIGIRLKSAYRNIRVDPKDVAILATTQDNYIWRLRLNPTVDGTFAYADITNSSLQSVSGATTNTISADGDLLIAEGFGTGNTSIDAILESALRIGSQIDGTMDELVLTVTPLSNNLTIYASIGVQEYV